LYFLQCWQNIWYSLNFVLSVIDFWHRLLAPERSRQFRPSTLSKWFDIPDEICYEYFIRLSLKHKLIFGGKKTWINYVSQSPYARSSMSISSSDGLSGSLSKSSFLKIIWQVEQERVPSQAPKDKTYGFVSI
jgi:hypothetical protein